MIAVIEAQLAWCPPTFSPSSLSRMWLAWWMVQADSHLQPLVEDLQRVDVGGDGLQHRAALMPLEAAVTRAPMRHSPICTSVP